MARIGWTYAGNTIQVSHMSGGDPNTAASIAASRALHWTEAGDGAKIEPRHSKMACGHPNWYLNQ